MSISNTSTTSENNKQKSLGLWVTRVFTIIGLFFFVLSIYIVIVIQQGNFDLADKVLMPVSVLMFAIGLISFRLVQRGQYVLGMKLLLLIILLFPIVVTLLLREMAIITTLFVLMLTPIMIIWIFPKSMRRWSISATAIAILSIIAIEIWNPAFRFGSDDVQNPALIATVLAAIAILTFAAQQAWKGNLSSKLTISFVLIAVIPLLITGTIVSFQSYSSQLPQTLAIQSQIAKRTANQAEFFIRTREDELLSLTGLRGLKDLNTEEQTDLLSSLLSSENVYDELVLLDNQGQEKIYLSRLDIIGSSALSSRAGAEEFEQPKDSGETYFGPVTFNDETGEPSMTISVPMVDLRSGNLSGVLIANFRFKTVWDIMSHANVIGSGIVYMIDSEQRVIAHPNPSIVLQETRVNLPAEDKFTIGLDGTEVAMARESIVLNKQVFSVIAEQPRSEALALVTRNITITIIIILIAMALAGAFGTFMARLITTPISELADAAENISSQQINIRRQDEIGILATAFNTMTSQLQETLQGLETRVADRTRALETSTEVSRRLSSILDQDQLVREVVEQLVTAFDYYYAHIYLFEEDENTLVMKGGTGEAGQVLLSRGHTIEKGTGLVGRAAARNELILVGDTLNEAGWQPNDLLPETRAEVAIPIAIGDDVLGVFDVQHNIINGILGVFDVQHNIINGITEEDANLLQSIANQVAIAVQNARVYVETQRRADREALLGSISQKVQSATTIEDTLQVAVRELALALNAEHSTVQLSLQAEDKSNL